jgi:divalent metal cation (Fe/Co/Zn/Cd) transporter
LTLGIVLATAGARAVVSALSGGVALLADVIHNGGDALTVIRRIRWESCHTVRA